MLAVYDGQFATYISSSSDALITSGLIPETLLVGVNTLVYHRQHELTPTGCPTNCTGCSSLFKYGGGLNMLDFTYQTVLPLVARTYSLPLPLDRSLLAVGGWSLGGLMACSAAVFRPHYFSRHYCGSPSLWFNCSAFAKQVLASPPSPASTAFYIDSGDAEDRGIMPDYIRASFESLLQVGFTPGQNLFLAQVGYGQLHEADSWAKRFYLMATHLFALPQAITWFS